MAVSVGVKVAVITVVPIEPIVTVAPEMVAVAVVADVYVNVPGSSFATVGAVKVKDASSTYLERSVKFERLGVAFEIVKELDTWDAAAKSVLPAWLALIVQVPTVIIVTVVPETLQTNVVADENTTDKPEVETAAKAFGLAP